MNERASVVGTRPRPVVDGRVDEVKDSGVCSSDREQGSHKEEEHVDAGLDGLAGRERAGTPAVPLPVVVEPHADLGDDGDGGAEESADEADEGAEDGDGGADDVRGNDAAGGAAEPGEPVGPGVGREVLGAAEDAHEDVLGGDVVEDGQRREEAGLRCQYDVCSRGTERARNLRRRYRSRYAS